mgnify:CR=1 FL=1|tara:strand:- start:554 stop:991 length:438 start_codon:yes stop_codon:yes gene_type:complete
MLNFFKNKNLKEDEAKPVYDIQLIGSFLAYEIAKSDGEVSNEELDLILTNVKNAAERTGKNEVDVMNLIEEYQENSISFNDFINDINNEFSYEQKKELIKLLWEIAYADNLLEVNEERLVRRIADLINLKNIKVLKLKNDAKNKT